MSNGNIVNLIPETKSFLTVETQSDGRIVGTLCDVDSNPLSYDAGKTVQNHLTEVYTDAISGKHFARIDAPTAQKKVKDGGTVFQGVGPVHGWFIPAPDYTINGRHGEKSAQN